MADFVPHATAGCKRPISSYPREGTATSNSVFKEVMSGGTLGQIKPITFVNHLLDIHATYL